MTRSIGPSLKAIADAVDAAEGAFDVALSDAGIAAICGETPKTLADLATALAALGTQTTLETLATQTTAAAIKTAAEAAAGLGLPTLGQDATGQDTYATVIAATPARVCRRLVAQCATKAAILSLDGGTTEHLRVEPGVPLRIDGLSIPAEAVIQAKNAGAGENYTALSISVW